MPPISAQSLGQKLRAAREAKGWSTRNAANKVSMRGIPLSHATLANYELGRTLPAMPTVELLAELYGSSINRLLGDTPVLTGVRYRALKSVRVRDRKEFEGDATRWIYTYIELENTVGRPLEPTVPPMWSCDGADSGSDLASRVREHLELGSRPIPSVTDLLENFGVRVLQVTTETQIDGLSAAFGDFPVVVLNPRVSNDRFRFNAAHELGHYLLDHWRMGKACPHAGDNDAHEFASHLLLPDSVLADAFKGFSMVRLVQYKEMFGISLAAMIYRAKRADLIEQDDYEYLFREFGRLGWRKREPGFVPPDRSTRLEQLIEHATTKASMSYRDVARLAAVDERLVRARVLEAIGGRLPEQENTESIPFRAREGRAPAT